MPLRGGRLSPVSAAIIAPGSFPAGTWTWVGSTLVLGDFTFVTNTITVPLDTEFHQKVSGTSGLFLLENTTEKAIWRIKAPAGKNVALELFQGGVQVGGIDATQGAFNILQKIASRPIQLVPLSGDKVNVLEQMRLSDAILDFSGTSVAGLVVKSLTTAQQDALSPSNGSIIFNTTLGAIRGFDGAWNTFSLVGHTHAAADIVSGTFADARIAASNVTQHVASIDHNLLLNFLIAEHRTINDAGVSTTDLWSASKITAELTAAVNSLDYKDAVETVATSNITLSGEQTVNGVTTSNSRVGVVGQTAGEDNGLYDSAAGAWTRATDMDASAEVSQGLTFFVGNTTSTKNGFQYILTTADPITLGTTSLAFTEVKRIELGTIAGTAAEGNDSRIPIQDQNDALDGTNGTPSSANKYVTNSDSRNSDSRTPSGAAGGDLGGTYPNPTVDNGADATAIHDDTSGEIAAVALKATPVGADIVLIEDSAASNAKKRTTVQAIADLGAGVNNNFAFAFDTTTQAISAGSTYQGLTFNNNAELDGWTHTLSTSIFGCNQTGRYLVTVNVTLEKSTGGTAELGMRALFNAVEVAGSMVGEDLVSNNVSVSLSKTFIVNATTGQNLEIEVASTSTNVSVLPSPDPGGATADVSASITISRIT